MCSGTNTMFDIVWLGRRVALRANNGKYVCTKKNGQLAAVSDSVGEFILIQIKTSKSNLMLFEKCKRIQYVTLFFPPGEDEQLILKLINRPMLILRGDNGYVCHHKNSNTLDANRSVYDIFTLQFNDGTYHIKGEF